MQVLDTVCNSVVETIYLTSYYGCFTVGTILCMFAGIKYHIKLPAVILVACCAGTFAYQLIMYYSIRLTAELTNRSDMFIRLAKKTRFRNTQYIRSICSLRPLHIHSGSPFFVPNNQTYLNFTRITTDHVITLLMIV